MIEIIEDWCNSNAENEKHGYFYQDYWWTSATYDEWAAMYPAMGKPRTLQRLLLKLESENYVISTQPKKGADNTKFYRVDSSPLGFASPSFLEQQDRASSPIFSLPVGMELTQIMRYSGAIAEKVF